MELTQVSKSKTTNIQTFIFALTKAAVAGSIQSSLLE